MGENSWIPVQLPHMQQSWTVNSTPLEHWPVRSEHVGANGGDVLAGMIVPIKITLCCNLFTIFAIRVLVTSEILDVQQVGVIWKDANSWEVEELMHDRILQGSNPFVWQPLLIHLLVAPCYSMLLLVACFLLLLVACFWFLCRSWHRGTETPCVKVPLPSLPTLHTDDAVTVKLHRDASCSIVWNVCDALLHHRISNHVVPELWQGIAWTQDAFLKGIVKISEHDVDQQMWSDYVLQHFHQPSVFCEHRAPREFFSIRVSIVICCIFQAHSIRTGHEAKASSTHIARIWNIRSTSQAGSTHAARTYSTHVYRGMHAKMLDKKHPEGYDCSMQWILGFAVSHCAP